jgi:arylsulfatase A-like enzyme
MKGSSSLISPQSLFIALLVSTAFIAASCSPEPEPKPEPPPRPNFVLVVVDTLRADRLHFAGYEKEISPNFDALRAESTYFPNARATSSWTLPSTMSLLVSQVPSQHGITKWSSLVDPEQTTLVELLHDAGYRTGGWTANLLLTEERGFVQGFDSFELVHHPEWHFGIPGNSPHAFASGDDLTSRALAWLEERPLPKDDVPFFLYLHYMEPHTPFLCPPGAGDACRSTAAILNRRLTSANWDFTATQDSFIEGFYDADVRRMDEALGHLYGQLKERGSLENTWLILTADHGEMLGEHDLYVHGRALYEETLRVPLLFRPPSGRGAVVETPVSLIDVAPTILDLAGIQPPPSFKGRSLRGALRKGPLEDRPLVAELFPVLDEPPPRHRHLLSVTRGTTKLVLGIDGKLERFDLANDPKEETPLPADMAELKALLAEADVAFSHLEASSETTPELSPEMVEQLKGLGYIQ